MSDIPETKVPIRLTIDGVSEVVSKVQAAQKQINDAWRKSIPEPKIFDVFEEAAKKTGSVASGVGKEIAVNWSAITRESKQAAAAMREVATQSDAAKRVMSALALAAAVRTEKLSYSDEAKRDSIFVTGGISGLSKEANNLSTIIRAMPSLAAQLGLGELGLGVERLRAIGMTLRGMWAARGAIMGTAGVAAGGIALGAIPIAYAASQLYENYKVKKNTTEGREENNLKTLNDLRKLVSERLATGELRGDAAQGLSSDILSLLSRQNSGSTSPYFRDAIGQDVQAQIPELFKRIHALTRESYATEEASQQQQSKTLLELERIRIESEQEIQRNALNAKLKDQNASEEDQIAAAERFTERMRGLSIELVDAQKSDLSVRESQLQAELERTGADPDARAKIKNALAQIEDDRTILKAETDAKMETLESEHQAKLQEIRQRAAEERQKEDEKIWEEQERLDDEEIAVQKEIARQRQHELTQLREEYSKTYAAIGNDFRLTEAQKYQQQSALVQQGFDRGVFTPADADALQSRLGPDPFSVQQQLEASVAQLQTSFGTVAQNIGATFQNVIGTAVNSISDGISGLILRTKTWGQALREIGAAILTSIVQSIVRMGVQWAVGFILQKTLGKAAAKSAIADASSVAASWGAAATAASIATMGSAAGVGLASTIAAMVAGSGFAGALSAAPAGSFARGGYTGDGPVSEVAGAVHGREFVFSAPSVARIGRANLEAIHASALGRGRDAAAPGSGSGVGGANITIGVLDERPNVKKYLNSAEGEAHLVDVINRTQHRWRGR